MLDSRIVRLHGMEAVEMNLNWFVLIAGCLYLGGAAVDLCRGNYALAGVYIAYAAANFCIVMVKP